MIYNDGVDCTEYISTDFEERDVSRTVDIGHWTFECPMSNIGYPANSLFLWFRHPGIIAKIIISQS